MKLYVYLLETGRQNVLGSNSKCSSDDYQDSEFTQIGLIGQIIGYFGGFWAPLNGEKACVTGTRMKTYDG